MARDNSSDAPVFAAKHKTGMRTDAQAHSPTTMNDNDEDPMIRFGEDWIPAQLAWKKMTTATVVVDTIDRFNISFPHLSTPNTRSVVPLARQRLQEAEPQIPIHYRRADLSATIENLLRSLSPEDAIDTLREQHDADLSMHQLIQLAGDGAYQRALAREATELKMNRISPQQTAVLWNDAARPAPGGGRWSAQLVETLLAS